MKLAWLVVVALGLFACGGKEPDYIIPPTTKVADAATMAALVAVNEDGSLEFSRSTSVTDSLSVGDIFNSNITPVAPSGLLRKITAIDRSGGRVTLQTVQGTLGEAIEKGDFEFNGTVSMADIPESPRTAAAGPTIRFDRGIVLDFDDVTTNFTTSGDQTIGGSIGLTGHMRFNPIFLMRGSIRNFHVENFEISFEFAGDSDLEMSVELAVAIERSREIYQLPLARITVAIGPVVIILTPVLKFKVGIGGSIAVSLSFHETASFSGLSGTRYDDGRGWTPLRSGHSEGTIDTVPSGSVSAVIDAYVGVDVDVLIYDVVSNGVYFYVKAGPSLDFETPRDPFLQAGIRLVAGMALHLFMFGSEFGSTTLLEYNELFPIWSSPNTRPTLLVTSPPNNLSFGPSDPVHFTAAVYDLEDGTGVPLTWTSDLDGVIGTGSDFTTTLHPAAPGLRNITVEAVDSAGEPRSVTFQLTISNPGSVPAIAEPWANQRLYTYDSIVRGSATSPFFPGADLCTAGFTFDWASSVVGDTIGPVRCSLGSARATITYSSAGPRTLTFGVTDPFGVRTTTTRTATITTSPAEFFGATGFSSPPPSSTFTSGSTVMLNGTADPRKVITDPYPFQTAVPLTFTFSATSYAADGVTELATIDIGSKVETDKATAGTGVTAPLTWIPASTPGFIDPSIAAMGAGQYVVLSFTAVDGDGHLGTAIMPILVTP